MRRVFFQALSLLLLTTTLGCSPATPATKDPVGSSSPATKDPEFDRLCADVSAENRAKCPVGAWAKSVDDIEGGVLIHLNATAPNPEETQKRMRCHRAWMDHDPSNAMPRCPIGAPGITITATAGPGGTDLSLIASKPEDIQEVRKRTHAAVGK